MDRRLSRDCDNYNMVMDEVIRAAMDKPVTTTWHRGGIWTTASTSTRSIYSVGRLKKWERLSQIGA